MAFFLLRKFLILKHFIYQTATQPLSFSIIRLKVKNNDNFKHFVHSGKGQTRFVGRFNELSYRFKEKRDNVM